MVGEYISRDYLLDEYDRQLQLILFQHQGPPGGARKIIAEAPAADVVERKVGHWIFHPEQKNIYGGKLIECSECRTQYLVMNVMEEIYCRHCGSKNQNGGQDDGSDPQPPKEEP